VGTRHRQGEDAWTLEEADPRSPEARALFAALWTELGSLYARNEGPPAFDPEGLRADGAGFLVARTRAGGKAVGCGAFRPLAPGVAEIKHVYVEPGQRGRGLARRLLAELETRARAAGYRVVRLETGRLQQAALELYAKAGYGPVSCWGDYALDPLSVCYEKALV
jgi:ribosomal protein S18 acetylase RimI-like enzyme